MTTFADLERDFADIRQRFLNWHGSQHEADAAQSANDHEHDWDAFRDHLQEQTGSEVDIAQPADVADVHAQAHSEQSDVTQQESQAAQTQAAAAQQEQMTMPSAEQAERATTPELATQTGTPGESERIAQITQGEPRQNLGGDEPRQP